MRIIALVSAFALCVSVAHAQKSKDIPAFGKIDKSEIELKECEFDKNAEAVVLFKTGHPIKNDDITQIIPLCRYKGLVISSAFIILSFLLLILIIKDKPFSKILSYFEINPYNSQT